MKNLLNKIIHHQPLQTKEAYDLLHAIDLETVDDVFVAAILTGIQMRGLHLNELVGFRKALLELCVIPEIDGSNAIDLCGTCLLYTSPSPRDRQKSRMPSSA